MNQILIQSQNRLSRIFITFKNHTEEAKSLKLINQILHGDNLEILPKLEDDSVDLTITSPPYRNAIDYTMHAKHGNDPKKNYRGS